MAADDRSRGRTPGRPRKDRPLTLRVHINYVSADEGRAIGIAQGNALRRALEALDRIDEEQRQQDE